VLSGWQQGFSCSERKVLFNVKATSLYLGKYVLAPDYLKELYSFQLGRLETFDTHAWLDNYAAV
jgi:hypothetical protein